MMMQLCQLAQDWRGTLPTAGAMIERKVDGWRALRFPGIDGKVRLWTRNGMPIEGVSHILHQLDRMERAAGEPMFLDGEFQVGGTLAATKEWCERGYKLGGEAGIFHVFDAVPLAAWRAGGDPTPLFQRKARLKSLMDATAEDEWEWRPGSRGRDQGATAVQMIPDEWAFDAADVIDAARRVWAVGGEGVVVKDADAPYQRNRNSAWLKVKQENFTKWRIAA